MPGIDRGARMVEERVRTGGFLELVFDRLMGVAQILGRLLGLHHAGAALGKRRLLAGFGRQRGQFLDGMAQPVRLAGGALDLGAMRCHRRFGVPPRRYHINRRIERAKTLLASPAQSVTDIALSLGFGQTSSFSAAFRDTTGTSPTEYRRTRP